MKTLIRILAAVLIVLVPLAAATGQTQRVTPYAPGTVIPTERAQVVYEFSTDMLLAPAPFVFGDVMAGVRRGWVQHYSNAGIIKDTLRAAESWTGYITGMTTDKAGNLYGTGFDANRVFKWAGPGLPHTATRFATTDVGSNVESIVQDTAGNFYVGQADGTRDILKLDKNTGAIIDRFDVPTGNRGTDWIDLAADQRTMFYTSEGNRVHRYDLVTRTALPDFQTVPLTGPLYCVKILRDGRVLVAATDKVYLLSPTGTIVRTYTVSGEGLFFAASLDPDGTSFWSGGLITNRFWKFDIATGAVLVGPVPTAGTETAGFAIYGETTVGRCVGNIVPAFVTPTPPCGTTVNATAGSPVSFTVRGTDGNTADVLNLNATGLPTGATMTPPLPVSGNPAQSVFNWTPTVGQVGNHLIVLRVADQCTTIVCSLTVNVRSEGDITQPECVLTSIVPGPPKQILITVRDQQSGLASVEVLTNTNCTVNVPTFTPGTTAPVVVTATKTNQELTAVVTLRVRDVAGNQTICDPVYTTLSSGTPQEFSLSDNYPNPFNPTTKIVFTLPKEYTGGVVTLKVYDLLGREVRTILEEPMTSGAFEAEWNGMNNKGELVESGVYLYRLVAGKYVATKKMTLLK